MVPARKWHIAQRKCMPCNGRKFLTVPCNRRSFGVNHRIPGCLRIMHIEPVTYQEVQILQGHSHPDVSRLEGIATTSELFTHRDLDATFVVRATEKKHDDRYNFYWYFTIPTLVAILLTIMICNVNTYLFINLLHEIRCTM